MRLNAGVTGDTSPIPGLGRSPGGGPGNPLQYSCLENPMDRLWATVYSIEKSRTRLKRLSTHAHEVFPPVQGVGHSHGLDFQSASILVLNVGETYK